MARMHAKLDVSGVISKVFELYGKYLATLLGIGAIIFIPLGIIEGVLRDGGIFLQLIGSLVGLVGTFLFVGSVTRLVQDVQDGRQDATVGQTIGSVGPVLVTLIVAGLLASIGISIGFLLIILPGVFLLTIWALISPVIVIENAGVGAAFGRSWALVKGNFWQVLGVIILFFIIELVVSAIFIAILALISHTVVLVIIASILARLLVAPLSALAAAVIYFELTGFETGVPFTPQDEAPAPPPPPPPAPNIGL